MKVLALDTSSTVAAAAVMEDEKLLGEYIINHKKTHSQKLMPMISELLASLEFTPADIDIYAAASGPGSFTGLRIGVTTVKTMAYAAKKPVAAVPTLDALAFNVFPQDEFLVCPIIDARNNQVYTAVYEQRDENRKRLTDYMGLPVSELAGILRGMDRKVIFLGDGVMLHRAFFEKELTDKCRFAPGSRLLQRASSVAQLALAMAYEGKLLSCFEMEPFYLRKSQAERELERKLKIDNLGADDPVRPIQVPASHIQK